MSVLSTKEQQLFDAVRASLPRLLFSKDQGPQELYSAYAKLFGANWSQIEYWFTQTYIRTATDAPLVQHAKDRGTRPQNAETDAELSERVRNFQDVVTVPALLLAADNAIARAGSLPPFANPVAVPAGLGWQLSVATGTSWATLYELRYKRGFFEAMGNSYRCFFDNGYRMGGELAIVIIVLPVHTATATAASVAEAVRKVKGNGVYVQLETVHP